MIRVPECISDLHRLAAVFDEIWGTTGPVVRAELLRAVQHAGGYVAIAEQGGDVVGGSFGFLGRHHGEPALHSHVTGVVARVRHTGVGRAIKLHQRAWAEANDLTWIVWTFDPLVRRNAWFNLHVLGARVDEYEPDFYGSIEDAVNVGDESDRLLVEWPVHPAEQELSASTGGRTVTVPTPDDIVELRQSDPRAAAVWRRRVRTELGERLAGGGRVLDFTRDGEYVVEIP